jgi:hypothetical protein
MSLHSPKVVAVPHTEVEHWQADAGLKERVSTHGQGKLAPHARLRSLVGGLAHDAVSACVCVGRCWRQRVERMKQEWFVI